MTDQLHDGTFNGRMAIQKQTWPQKN